MANGIPSNARRFFEELVTGPPEQVISRIERLADPSAPTLETEWLEFKSGSISNDKIGEQWSRALSAFANAGGGVFVWGLKSSRVGGSRVDAATEVVPLQDALATLGMLDQVAQHANEPPVVGIVNRAFPRSDGSGFVVSFIPESEFKPHRAEKCAGKPYYVRIGTRTEFIPHPLLRQMFYPKGQVAFALLVSAGISRDQSDFSISLQNVGNLSARDIVARFHGDATGGLRNRGARWTPIDESYYCLDSPLHPGQTVKMMEAKYSNSELEKSILGVVTLYCSDSIPHEIKFGFYRERYKKFLSNPQPQRAAMVR